NGTVVAAQIWDRAPIASSPRESGEISVPATLSIIMPAYHAGRFIASGVRSVLAQTWSGWELVIVSDDGEDYEARLAAQGLVDRRFRFLSTGAVGAGASRARNLALETITTPYVAVLDADDRFRARK